MEYTIEYSDETGETFEATVRAASFDEADDAATEMVAQFARRGRHISIESVETPLLRMPWE